MVKLSLKHQAFADYYIELGNAEQAAIKAGYSKTYSRGNAHKLVAKESIKLYIAERMEELKSERVADQQEVMEFLTSVLRGEARGTALVGEGMGAQAVEQVMPSVAEKVRAAEQIGKRYAMWTDKQQVEGLLPVTIVNDLDD